MSSSIDNRGSGPLQGLRVLDITTIVLGPYATQILGDYGADVIKIEPLDGDVTRANGVSRRPGMSSLFLTINRNKKSIALDLKKAEGKKVFLELAASVDVVIHNMRMQAIAQLGLDYEHVKSVNPTVVYCAATGFGQDGPYRDRPCMDDIVQAASGVAALARNDKGAPSYVPSLIADKTTGLAVVNAVLAALWHRERTGRGQFVEVPMFESMVEFNLTEHMGGLAFDPPAAKAGYPRIAQGGRQMLPTSDGFAAVLPYSVAHWTSLFQYLGRDDLLKRYDLSDKYKINAVVRQLYGELGAEGPKRTTAQWMALCEELDIPASPVYGLDDLPRHPQLKAVNAFQIMAHPSEGAIRHMRPSVRFQDTPARIRLPAPLLGQDTRSILHSLGYSNEDIASLAANKVIAFPPGATAKPELA